MIRKPGLQAATEQMCPFKIAFLSFIACFCFLPGLSSAQQPKANTAGTLQTLSSLFWGTEEEILSAPLAPGSCPGLLVPFFPNKYDSPEQRWVIKVPQGLCAQPYQPLPRDCFPGSQWQDLLLCGGHSFSLPPAFVLHK